jgi:hypothetical protein
MIRRVSGHCYVRTNLLEFLGGLKRHTQNKIEMMSNRASYACMSVEVLLFVTPS